MFRTTPLNVLPHPITKHGCSTAGRTPPHIHVPLSLSLSLTHTHTHTHTTHTVVDYTQDLFNNSLKVNDPAGLWVSTATDPFPDPTTDMDAFLRYCGYSREHLTALLYLVTREMLDGEETLRPLVTHDPFVYCKALVDSGDLVLELVD